jgi:amine acid ABC transporter, permease protein, 3-TM region, His/Glu/Gln/Arg/opine family
VLVKGIGFTLSLFVITIITSIPLGFGLTFMSNSKFRVLRALTRAYVFVMRGTPLMLQLFFFYFGLPFIPFIGQFLVMDRFPAACLTFALNYAAYFCEIFRGGLLSVDPGQYEAARVLGLTGSQTTFRIVVPQMIKVVLPSVANEAITLVKDTALASVIGITDLLHYTRALVNSRSDITPFFVAAVFYLLFTLALTNLFNKLEKKYKF